MLLLAIDLKKGNCPPSYFKDREELVRLFSILVGFSLVPCVVVLKKPLDSCWIISNILWWT